MPSVATAELRPAKKRTPNLATNLLATAAIVVIAVVFVLRYVFHYYLNYDPAASTNPMRGARWQRNLVYRCRR